MNHELQNWYFALVCNVSRNRFTTAADYKPNSFGYLAVGDLSTLTDKLTSLQAFYYICLHVVPSKSSGRSRVTTTSPLPATPHSRLTLQCPYLKNCLTFQIYFFFSYYLFCFVLFSSDLLPVYIVSNSWNHLLL